MCVLDLTIHMTLIILKMLVKRQEKTQYKVMKNTLGKEKKIQLMRDLDNKEEFNELY